MTQEELAKKMGYQSRSSINKVECGREVSQRIIVRLAEALDVTVPYLMGWDLNPEEQAAYEASILMDDDIMELVHGYKTLNAEQKAAVRQMVVIDDDTMDLVLAYKTLDADQKAAVKQMAKLLSTT